MEEPWTDVAAAAEWVEQLRREHQPDLLHMNTLTPVLDPDVPVLLSLHSCVLTWWRAVRATDAPGCWDRYRALARRALDRATALAVPSAALLAELQATYGRLPPGGVIHNGRAVSVPRLSRERLVLSVGRAWDEAKNVSLLARCAARVHGQVAVLGAGPVDGLQTLGHVSEPDVLAWLARASVFAEPARYEPFGLAALEAALCGCALVLGDIPSLREVWGEAATFVAPDDGDALVRALNALLDDPVRRAWAGMRARARALHYPPEQTAHAYLDAYRRLARTAVSA
jgi:glycosyltransferase involved in cell wall biosynthesis